MLRTLAVDWSGAKTGAHRSIYLAEVTDGTLVRLQAGRTRDQLVAHLLEDAARDPDVVIGLDFAFSLPAWFAHRLGATTPEAVWAEVDRSAESWLKDCDPPFWGRAGTTRPDLPEHFRRTEHEAARVEHSTPKSVFHVHGPGTVGAGSLRGMPYLTRLRDAGFSIWPFHPPGRPMVVEIYPRLFTGKVKKSDPGARAAYLADGFPEIPDHLRTVAIGTEDAFDAAVSAVVMARHGDELTALTRTADAVERLEGRIWWPAPAHASTAARDSTAPRPASPAAPSSSGASFEPLDARASSAPPRPPSPAEQIHFLRSLQRLLDEGLFTASYKYALLHAIADLCVTAGDDSGAALELGTDAIAEQLVRLYWRQVAPFVARDDEAVLRQNTGRRAAVIRELADRHERYEGSLSHLTRDDEEWMRLRSAVEVTVRRYPLWKLQTVGSDRLDFLYENVGRGSSVRLEPGVAYCFRAFYPMITDMLQGAWATFVQRRNPDVLEQVVDLRSFLFGTQRAALDAHRPWLRELQEGRCFYCDVTVRGGHVDHFIPWRRYPLDLGHNFVLAHQRCNSQKSDLLAAEEHLARWVDRNRSLGLRLGSAFEDRGVQHDLGATELVARWAYGQVQRAGGQVWVLGKTLKELSDAWEGLLRAG